MSSTVLDVKQLVEAEKYFKKALNLTDKKLNSLYQEIGNTSVAGRWVNIKADVAVDDVVSNICAEL